MTRSYSQLWIAVHWSFPIVFSMTGTIILHWTIKER